MGFSFEEAFKHLDGTKLTYSTLMDEVIAVRRKYLGDLAPEINSHDMFFQLMQMGWISFPDDGSSGGNETCIFAICEDVRKVRERIETYKRDFITEQAKRFLQEEEEDGQFYPHDVKVEEYRTAVQEVAAGNF